MSSTFRASLRFPSELKMAIISSGKSLEEITQDLRAHGIRTTPQALHAWETGEVLPRPKASENAISALEEILNLPSGTLLSSFTQDLAENTLDPDYSGVSSHYSNDMVFSQFQGIDEHTDWNEEVYREELNENILVSSDFRKLRQSVRLGVRVPYKKRGTLHVSTFWDVHSPPALDDIGVYEIDGAIVGETTTERNADGTAKTTTLLLPDDAIPGDLHYISYEHRFVSNVAQRNTAQRAFSWHLNSYSCSVTFLGHIPERIEWILTSIDKNPYSAQKNIQTHPLTPTGNTVTVSINDIDNALGMISWH